MITDLKQIEREIGDMAAGLRATADHLDGLAKRVGILAEKSASDAGAVTAIATDIAADLVGVKARLAAIEKKGA